MMTISTHFLGLSKLYKEGTINYIKSLSLKEFFKIVFVKLKSNFNPFPEKPKPGALENIAIFFRILYLIVFLQCIYYLIKRKLDVDSINGKVCLVVISILVGQIMMSVLIYTGLRFNAIYGLTMLFCFLYLNTPFFVLKIKKLQEALLNS